MSPPPAEIVASSPKFPGPSVAEYARGKSVWSGLYGLISQS